MTDANSQMAQVLAALLKEEREKTNSSLEDLAERLDTLDGNALIKSSAIAIADANLAALRSHAENILLRKSKHLGGRLPPVATGIAQ